MKWKLSNASNEVTPINVTRSGGHPKDTSAEAKWSCCNKGCSDIDDEDEKLRQARTSNINAHVRQCAMELQDSDLMAELSLGDMHAQDAMYHV